MLYELLIRGKADGTISGSHIIEFDANGNPGIPRPIKDSDWAGIAPGINGALVAQVATQEAALTAATAQIAAFSAAKAGDFGPLREVLAAASMRDTERKRAAAEAALAKAQADLAALEQ